VKRARLPEPDVEGRPHLALLDADREAVAEVIADLLVVAALAKNQGHAKTATDTAP